MGGRGRLLLLWGLCSAVSHVRACPQQQGQGLPARLAEWKTCLTFEAGEDTVGPPFSLSLENPQLLDPAKEGSFAQHTLLKRLPATAERLISDKAVDAASAEKLRLLAKEIPHQVPLKVLDRLRG